MTSTKENMHQAHVETSPVEKIEMEHRDHHDESKDHNDDFASAFGSPDSPESKEAERRVVRKLDMTLLPIVWVLYMFNYLDRNNIAYVASYHRPFPAIREADNDQPSSPGRL